MTTKHGFVVRRFQVGDEAPLNALFNRVFDHERSLAEWYWKFEGNRAASGIKTCAISVAESGGTIVGQFASQTFRFKIFNQETILAHGVDTVVDPAHRLGARVILDLTRDHAGVFRDLGILFGYGVPNTDHGKVGSVLLNYRDICSLSTLWRRLNWRHTLRHRYPTLPAPAIGAVSRTWAAIEHFRLRHADGVLVRQVERFDSAVDNLWQRARDRYSILAVRDSRYLNWRYADHPQKQYVIFQAEAQDRLVGFIVLRLAESAPDKVGMIMDLFTEADPTTQAVLVRQALRWFLSRDADYVLCRLVPTDPVTATFHDCGFSEHSAFPSQQVICAPFDRAANLANAPSWHLGWGDFDEA